MSAFPPTNQALVHSFIFMDPLWKINVFKYYILLHWDYDKQKFRILCVLCKALK